MEKRGILIECPKCKGRVAYGLRVRKATADEMIDIYKSGVLVHVEQIIKETYAWCKRKETCGWEEP